MNPDRLVAGFLGTILMAAALEAQDSWGRRTVQGHGTVTAQIDERPAVLEISVCDWALSRSAPEVRLFPTLKAIPSDRFDPSRIHSFAMIEAAAKRFDDALYATVEILAQHGWRGGAGKASFLKRFARAVADSAGELAARGEALARLLAARKLGGSAEAVPDSVRARVDALLAAFNADPARSRTLGFYSASPELSSIFRQDRFLQDAADTSMPEGAWLRASAEALSADDALRSAYRSLMRIPAVMTDTFSDRSLLEPAGGSVGKTAVFPASRSLEGDLLKRLFGDRPIPDGHAVMDDIVAAVRGGTVDLKPGKSSGWYAWQTWALEPLLRNGVRAEAGKIRFGEGYREHAEELFRAAGPASRWEPASSAWRNASSVSRHSRRARPAPIPESSGRTSPRTPRSRSPGRRGTSWPPRPWRRRRITTPACSCPSVTTWGARRSAAGRS